MCIPLLDYYTPRICYIICTKNDINFGEPIKATIFLHTHSILTTINTLRIIPLTLE